MWTAEIAERLDVFLARSADITRERAKELVRNGSVRVNGRIERKPACRLEAQDTIDAELGGVPATETHLQAVDLALPILYEDGACFVLLKPAGIAVHPARGIPRTESTLLHGIAHLYAQRNLPFDASHALVHRLDRETTGCLIVAKSHQAHAALQKQFQQRTVRKRYLALVAGRPNPPAATIDAPVGRNLTDRTKMSVLATAASRPAQTTYHTLATADAGSLLLCDLHTGRTHQIRVHLQTIGHPILGDPTYGSSVSEALSKQEKIDDLCLHAFDIVFVSPADQASHAVRAPLPSPFTATLKRVGIDPDGLSLPAA